MRSFKMEDLDPLDSGYNVFSKRKFAIETGVTVLIGCNGSGKSTMLKVIKSELEEIGIPFIYYDNYKNGGSHARNDAFFRNDFSFVGASMCSSEGENINMNINIIAGKISDAIFNIYRDSSEIWILLDAVDSGLSIDNIIELKEFFDAIINTAPDKDIYIVVSANEYELAQGQKCFDVQNCKYRCIRTYSEYRNFIIRSKERKENRKNYTIQQE